MTNAKIQDPTYTISEANKVGRLIENNPSADESVCMCLCRSFFAPNTPMDRMPMRFTAGQR